MIKVKVPATSGNLGIGFDVLGLALNKYASFEFDKSDELVIDGCPKEYQNINNLVVTAFYHTCDYLNQPKPTFYLKIDSDLPMKRGLGSSATLIVGGIIGCYRWFKMDIDRDEVLKLATMIEGHPDNVAPAIFGGMVASHYDNHEVRYLRYQNDSWRLLAIVPDTIVETSEARKILPQEIKMPLVCDQLFNVISFIEAFNANNQKMLFASLKDHLHEPYRKKLIPIYETIKSKCDYLELPFWISGSGSTLIVIANEIDQLNKLKKELDSNLLCLDLLIDNKGASYE